MKKRIFSFLMFFISIFCLNNIDVNAIVCSYGTRTGDDPNTWSKKIQFEVNSWDKVFINQQESPLLSGAYDLEQVTGEAYDYKGKKERNGFDDNLYLYVSLYPNETVYNNLKGACPKIIKYRYTRENSLVVENDKHMAFYNDDLDKPEEEYSFWKDFKEDETKEEVLIEESQKEAKTDDLVDNYGCVTYSSSLDEIKKAKDASDSKSCDNNPEFNYIYQNLSQVCESYRSTALYATDDGDKIVAKACQKACSRLKDDVSNICNAAPEGGYCGSLGNKIVNWIFRIVRIVRYAVPVLLIILSILDYIKALAADDENEMKKVTGRFVRRLIAAALIFIIPFILDFVLRIFDIPGLNASNPFCAK